MSEEAGKLSPLDEAGIAAAVEAAKAAFDAAGTLEELKEARLAHSGDNAPITHANTLIRGLDKSEKPVAGRLMGAARKAIQGALAAATRRLEEEAEARAIAEEKVDVTLPSRRNPQGARHPLTVLMEDVADFFVGLGWDIAEGPEVEHEWFNFDALNFGPDHPARQMQDTFYVEGVETVGATGEGAGVDAQPGLVLRTHTSPVQARTLLQRDTTRLQRGLPLYVAVPGRVYRTDELDATHTPVFHQVEGLAVDRGLTMAHLKGTLDHFARAMFGPDAVTRLRPSYFPFTEPSAEMDLRCFVCRGEDPDCRTCKGTGWIEWGGCGMVNRNVLTACGVDPDRYTGFAFGMGIDRALMFRTGVSDMRDMIEGDVRFNAQFGMEI